MVSTGISFWIFRPQLSNKECVWAKPMVPDRGRWNWSNIMVQMVQMPVLDI